MRPGKSVLLVEGRDDLFVCKEIFMRHGIPTCFDVEAHMGVGPLLRAFSLYLENTAYSRVGLIIDADESSTGRWNAVRHTLTDLGYPDVPRQADPLGTVLTAPEEDRPVAGVWIMPDNRLPGILEDFIRFLIPASDPLLTYAEACVDGIPAQERRFPKGRRSKALIHTWLAWQEEPGAPLGLAIKKKYLEADHEQGRRLADWCRRLFIEASDP